MKPYLFIILLLAASLACSFSSISQQITPSGGTLFQDDFHAPDGGWGQATSPNGFARLGDGDYRIRIDMPEMNAWSHPGRQFTDVRVDVDASLVTGPVENRMGLICRLQDDSNFYFFVISSDGYFGIGKVKDGQVSLLNMPQMQKNGAIYTDGRVNHLRVDCIRDFFIFYANDQILGAALDSDFTNGDVGLLAGTFTSAGVEVSFDNFVVRKP